MPLRLPLPAVPRVPAAPRRTTVLRWLGPALLGGLIGLTGPAAHAQISDLLEKVKSNPALARSYCARFSQLNGEGVSATSPASIAEVASRQKLSAVDAEVLITYIIGMNCPDVR
ncbi:MAG: hypothetical protein VKK62_00940 [Synechococcaceae cyanobacterium]|nr:hypothetical protein [Synechococcaceae cyanobacterium]